MDHQEWLEQHDRMMADHEIMMAELRKNQAKTDNILRMAIRLAVQDARRQRIRNKEFAETMAQIAAAQQVNEGLLKAFLERGGNGKH